MKSLGAAITAALLLWGTTGARAEEPIPAPFAPMSVGAAGPACSAHASCGNCGAGNTRGSCGSGCCNGGRNSGKLLDWCTYWPQRTRFGECCSCCTPCRPPLYLYFLGSCQEHTCTSCGCGHDCGNRICH